MTTQGSAAPVQDPPLMPWEHEAVTEPSQAMMEFAGELDNERHSGQGAPEKKPAEEEAEVEETDDDEPEVEDEPELSEDEGEHEGAEWDLQEGEFEQIARSRPHRLKVDGEEIEVTYDDLLAGFSRTEDYTRKSQRREEERRAEKAANAEVREQLIERLRSVEAAMEEVSPERSAEYWDTLRSRDPQRYQLEWADAQRAREHKDRVRQQREKEEAEAAREYQEDLQEYARGEFEALSTKMGWKDDNEARQGLQGLADFAVKEYGFSAGDLSRVLDHRLLLLFHHAQQHLTRQKKGTEEIQKKLKKTKPLEPGGRRSVPVRRRRVNRKAVESAARELEQTGTVKAAASLFEHLLANED